MGELVIMRHGVYGHSDHLTPTGREQVTKVAYDLAKRLSGPPEIRTSPVVRAKETAEIVQGVLGGTLIEDQDLTANYVRLGDLLTRESAERYLADLPKDRPVILISHVDICGLFLEILNLPPRINRGQAILMHL